jgi:hypothetical protein
MTEPYLDVTRHGNWKAFCAAAQPRCHWLTPLFVEKKAYITAGDKVVKEVKKICPEAANQVKGVAVESRERPTRRRRS